jgi:predicted transcriptional regulator
MPDQAKKLGHRFLPEKTGIGGPLGALEQGIMQALWVRTAPASVAEVHEALPLTAYTTLKTTLERLTDKGILTRVRHGKAYLYQPVVTEEELERRIVALALERLVDRFPHAVAAFFAAPGDTLSEDTAARLQEAIARRREEEETPGA